MLNKSLATNREQLHGLLIIGGCISLCFIIGFILAKPSTYWVVIAKVSSFFVLILAIMLFVTLLLLKLLKKAISL